ncbi:penicillin-binding protein [Candidatus Gracilibacteria bacterium]|nr:penicillin-binding protein [Candidatus Gracilibacteria bacterium]
MIKKLKRFLPKQDLSLIKKIGFWSGILAISGTLLGILLIASIVGILSIGLPDVTDLENLAAAQSTQILDRDGNLLYSIHGEENREEVKLNKISQDLVNATIAIEDDQFYQHGGFDLPAIIKAFASQVFGIGAPRGGSTITQQYVKNTFLSAERSYTRKIKELVLAIRLERSFDKNDIIELYLNRIPYGNNAYGIGMASKIYFDKEPIELTIAESAFLAGLPQAPSRYNPFGQNRESHLITEITEEEANKRNINSEFDLNIDEYARGLLGAFIELPNGSSFYVPGRADLVLKRMENLEMITTTERQDAVTELQNLELNTYRENIKHPHFVLWIKGILEERYGKEVVEQGGLKVTTTINEELQAHAEEVAFERGTANETNFNADNLSILTINANTGQILAMVGSRDYFNEEIDGNVNVVFRPRQPGSSFKPLVYAQSFYEGYAPGSVIYDVPTKVGSDEPSNYKGNFQGQVTIRRALAQSINIPAIKAYFLAGRQDPIIDLATAMGITTLDKSRSYGYPLALGSGEVPLSEMVTAYATFANGGKKPELTGILKVENANGDVLEEWQAKEFDEVLDPQVAYLINSILSDRENSVGARLFIEGKINAAKTGTSTKENKKESGGKEVRPSDAWTIGYTPSIVTGVWAGNTDGSGMSFSANGYDTASAAYNSVMKLALRDMPAEPFPVPEGITEVAVSKASGKLPSADTPDSLIRTEPFASFSIPTETERLFFKVKIDKVSGKLATEFTPEDAVEEVTFQNYEAIADMLNWNNEIRDYYKDLAPEEGSSAEIRVGLPPTDYDEIHNAQTAANAPTVTITSPVSQSSITPGPFTVEIEIDAKNGIERVEYFIDEQKEFFTATAPFFGHLRISKFMPVGSRQLIIAKIIDKLGYSSQSAIEIKVAAPTE